MHVYLACFDISSNRIRYRVVKKLGHYGNRVQKSVFEITLKNKQELAVIQREMAELLDVGDRLYFYHLCQNCREKSVDVDNNPVAQYPAVLII